MKNIFLIAVALFNLFYSSLSYSQTPNEFVALCYHDVSVEPLGNNFSVLQKDFVQQLEYLKANYNVVSMQDILDASKGKKNLPPKAVLLTVDDGLESFYKVIFPLLKSYKMKGVFAVVGQWTENGVTPDYGFKTSNPKTAGWDQLKEMTDSGWVDVVSHSFDLHQWQTYNPQGNSAPSAGFLKYDLSAKVYETDEAFMQRISIDLQKNNELLKKHLGSAYPVIVWPYGSFNGLSTKAAAAVELPIQFTIQPGINHASDLRQVRRGFITAKTTFMDFKRFLETAFLDERPMRLVKVDMDSRWSESEQEREAHLATLLEHASAANLSDALVQSISSTGEAYFPTKALKVRGDYLNRMSSSLRSRAQVTNVFARIPTSVLKDQTQAEQLLTDLVKYVDLDGVIFEAAANESLINFNFVLAALAAGKSMRPTMTFGYSGHLPGDAQAFDYVVLSYHDIEQKNQRNVKLKRAVVAMSTDLKSKARLLNSQGHSDFYYNIDIEKKSILDPQFTEIFSVRQKTLAELKGELK